MIIRADHSGDYFCLSNSAVRDARLSLEARGFLIYLLSMSDGWEFSIGGLTAYLGLTRATVMRLVKELKTYGYVKQRRTHSSNGRYQACVWDVYENPTDNKTTTMAKNTTVVKMPSVDNLPSVASTTVWSDHSMVSPQCGFGLPIRNTNSKEIPNKEEVPTSKKHISGRGEFSNVLITDAEFQKLTDRFGEAGRDSRIENLSRYLAQHPRKKYASHYATILAWDSRDKKAAKVDRSQPQQQKPAGGVDWDNVAKLAAEMAAGEVPYYDFD